MKINTPIFNDQQKRFALILLSLFHIFIITASNYFVQIPFEINLKLTALGFADDFSFHSTWGTLTFPFIFLATDLTVRVFGAKEARWIIFIVMLPALIVSYIPYCICEFLCLCFRSIIRCVSIQPLTPIKNLVDCPEQLDDIWFPCGYLYVLLCRVL